MGSLGNAHAALGEPHRAIAFNERQLAIAREVGNRRGEGLALWNSANQLWKLDERREATNRAEQALTIFEAIDSPHAGTVRAGLARWRGEVE